MMKEENKVMKEIITGNAVPKSVSLIEMEKNYALLAQMVGRLIDRIRIIENDMEKLQKCVATFVIEKKEKKK
jgi:hypothetical protein